MSLEDLHQQSQRILQTSVDLANSYIARLKRVIMKQRDMIDNVAAALEQVKSEKAEVLLRFAETEMEVFRLEQELRRMREQSETTVAGQGCSNATAMARQNGYRGHADRPPSR